MTEKPLRHSNFWFSSKLYLTWRCSWDCLAGESNHQGHFPKRNPQIPDISNGPWYQLHGQDWQFLHQEKSPNYCWVSGKAWLWTMAFYFQSLAFFTPHILLVSFVSLQNCLLIFCRSKFPHILTNIWCFSMSKEECVWPWGRFVRCSS